MIDLGVDVEPEIFVEAIQKNQPDILGLSALLTTTMPVMKQVVQELAEQGLQDQVKTIVGGAPLSDDYAAQIGADAYAYDAANAVEKIRQLMGIDG